MTSSYGLIKWAERGGSFTNRISVVTLESAGPWVTIEDTQRGRMHQRFRRRLLPYFVWYNKEAAKVYFGSNAENAGERGYRLYLHFREGDHVERFVKALWELKLKDVKYEYVTQSKIDDTFESHLLGEPSAGQQEHQKRKALGEEAQLAKRQNIESDTTVAEIDHDQFRLGASMDDPIPSIETTLEHAHDTTPSSTYRSPAIHEQERLLAPSFSPFTDQDAETTGNTTSISTYLEQIKALEGRIKELEEDALAHHEQKQLQKGMSRTLRAMLECYQMKDQDIDECAIAIQAGRPAIEVLAEWQQSQRSGKK